MYHSTTSSMWLDQALRDNFFFGKVSNGYVPPKYDPYKVTTERRGDYVIVKSSTYYEEIPMKDSFLMKLTSKTWESKVRDAQREAFDKVYESVMKEERLEYQVSRLI